jgi:hypothetical protein
MNGHRETTITTQELQRVCGAKRQGVKHLCTRRERHVMNLTRSRAALILRGSPISRQPRSLFLTSNLFSARKVLDIEPTSSHSFTSASGRRSMKHPQRERRRSPVRFRRKPIGRGYAYAVSSPEPYLRRPRCMLRHQHALWELLPKPLTLSA